MGGCKCSFRNCTNATKLGKECHFFHFPVKQWDRCAEWIKQSQKPHFLDLHVDQLKNKVICEEHFADNMFINAEKKRLLKYAVPRGDPDDDIVSKADVKVVPKDADGTIFTLDEEFLNNSNSYIPTYNIDNGTLVLKQEPMSISDEEPSNDSFTKEEKPPILNITKPIKIMKPKIVKTIVVNQIIPAKKNSCQIFAEEPCNLSQDSDEKIRDIIAQCKQDMKKTSQEKLDVSLNEEPDVQKVCREIVVKKASRNRKRSIRDIVKQHSIAISRLEKLNSTRQNTLIRKLKRAPPSYITLLNVLTNTSKKHTPKEMELVKILSSNKETLKILQEQLGWNLSNIQQTV